MTYQAIEPDWASWVSRWDRQQQTYVRDRDDQLGFMFDVAEQLGAAPGRMVDLACGPGSISARAVERFPAAEIVAIDMDPLLLELGRRTLGDRVQWIDENLRGDGWKAAVEPGSVDLVFTATALHWIPMEERGVFDVLSRWLRPGGAGDRRSTEQPSSAPKPSNSQTTPQGRRCAADLQSTTLSSGGHHEAVRLW